MRPARIWVRISRFGCTLDEDSRTRPALEPGGPGRHAIRRGDEQRRPASDGLASPGAPRRPGNEPRLGGPSRPGRALHVLLPTSVTRVDPATMSWRRMRFRRGSVGAQRRGHEVAASGAASARTPYVHFVERVRPPVSNGIAVQFCRHASQASCPWNHKFAREVNEPAFEARAVIAGKDARTLATELLAMSEDEFRAAFKGSAMKRAKLAGLRRSAELLRRPPSTHRLESVSTPRAVPRSAEPGSSATPASPPPQGPAQ